MDRTQSGSSSTMWIFGTAMLAEFGTLSVESAQFLSTGVFPTYTVDTFAHLLTKVPPDYPIMSTHGFMQGFMDLPLTSAIVVVAVTFSLVSKLR